MLAKVCVVHRDPVIPDRPRLGKLYCKPQRIRQKIEHVPDNCRVPEIIRMFGQTFTTSMS